MWRHIQNDPGADNNFPKWKSALPVSDSIKAPFQYFKYFLDNELLDRIVLETNLYGVQKNSNKPVKLTKSELEKFLGCCMLMSIIKLPRSRMYWANDTRIRQVFDVMPRDRWEAIKVSLHFNDNSKMPS